MTIQLGILTAYNSSSLSHANTGLGNILFQIASLYGIAKRTNRKVSYNSLRDFSIKLKELFNYNHGITIYRNFLLYEDTFSYLDTTVDSLSIFEKIGRTYNSHIVEEISNSDLPVILRGHFEYPEYFHDYRNDIVDLLSIDDTSMKYINDNYSMIHDKNITCVSIHFRFGDFGKDLYLPYKYYMDATKYICDTIDNVLFLIFSDEIEKTREFIEQLPIKYIFVKNNPDYIDLWLMSLCKHNITCRSTFSWWGAYLNNNPEKIVIYKEGEPNIYNFVKNSMCL
jgi:hypothetical protein